MNCNNTHRQMIESLEPRRLLANFNGTNGPDTITIASAGGMTQVIVNGFSQETTDPIITVHALGGNDTVYFPVLRKFNDIGKDITVNLGDGDDWATNFDTINGGGSFNDIEFDIKVNGNNGNDTLAIDNTDGGTGFDYILQHAAETTLTVEHDNQFRAFRFNTFENLTIDCPDVNDWIFWESKPDALRVTVNGNGASDIFWIGNQQTGTDWSEDGGWISGTTTLAGGAGEDFIQFEDASSPVHFGGYIEDFLTLTKNNRGFTYSAFEGQRIIASAQNIFTFHGISGFFENTELFAVNCTVNVGNGNLNNLSGDIALHVPGPQSSVIINDQNDTGNDNYLVTTPIGQNNVGRFVKNSTQTIEYFGLEGPLTLNANQGANNIAVQATTVGGSATIINGGGESDSFTLGNGNVGANLRHPVTINGGANGGFGEVVDFDNRIDTTAGTQTLNGLIFTDGQTHTLSSVDSILIQNGSGGGTLNMDRVSVFTNVSSGSSNQTVDIGAGNLDANLLADCTVSSATIVNIDDRLDTGNDNYILDPTGYRKTTAGARDVDLGSVASINLLANSGHNTITVNNAGNNLGIFAGAGNDSIVVADTKPNFVQETIGVDTGPETPSGTAPFGDTINVNSDAGGAGDVPARVRLLNTDTLFNLNVNIAGTFILPTAVACVISNGVGLSGVVDFAGGAMVLRNGSAGLASFVQKLVNGYANGAWNGTTGPTGGAFNSSLAAGSSLPDGIGYAKASDISGTFPFILDGAQVNAVDAVFRYTFYGDTDLNQTVDFDDYVRTDTGFNNALSGWANGDFDFNNSIDFDDYVLIDSGFNSQ